MPVQRMYRRVEDDLIDAHHIDCGMYLFLIMVSLRADESLGMLLPAIVYGARPLLACSLVLRSNPIVISHWVRLNPVRGPITQDVESEPITTARTMVTGSLAGAVPQTIRIYTIATAS